MDKTMLLVEDNPDDAKLTLRAFQKNNIMNPVVVARDGVEALDFLFGRGAYAERAGGPPPTLVVLDLKLPRLDGLGVLKAMRADARTKHIPVVVLTSSEEEQDVVSSYAFGANSYVRKPVDFAEFVEAAKLLGLYWLVLNQPLRESPGR
jgi:two-component system response regulator